MTKNLAVISRPSGLWMRQFPRLPLRRRRCSLYARLFDSRAPTTFYPLMYHLRRPLPPPPLPPFPPPPAACLHAPRSFQPSPTILLYPSFLPPISSSFHLSMPHLSRQPFFHAESRESAPYNRRGKFSSGNFDDAPFHRPACYPHSLYLSPSTIALYHPRSSDPSHPGWRSNR